jgi:CRP-like cAMP-binding protein
MASTAATIETHSRPESLLATLPVSNTCSYRKGEIIYRSDDVLTKVYLVLSGMVAISWVAEGEARALLEVRGPEELFGEFAFLGGQRGNERAVALGNVTVMMWDAAVLEEMLCERPGTGMALLSTVARRNSEYGARIASLARETVESRLAGSLISFAKRLGEPDEAGWIRLMPLTHELLAGYVATSRGLITMHMNRFRREGWLTYSSTSIRIQPEGLRRTLGVAADG